MLKGLAAGFLTVMVLSPSAMAQTSCMPRETVASSLRHDYAEAPAAFGVTADGALLELWISKNGETWTILVTLPTGTVCLVADGNTWQEVTDVPTGKSM